MSAQHAGNETEYAGPVGRPGTRHVLDTSVRQEDPYDGEVLSKGFGAERAEPIRKSMGYVLDWSRRVDLASLIPHGE